MERVAKNLKPFSGEKYSIWKYRMRGLLAQHGVLKVIDDETPSVVTDDWTNKENLAKGLIIENLSDSFLKYAKETDTAKEVFIYLDSVFERKSVASQLAIRKKLFNFKLKSECTLAEHFIIFDDLLTDLMSAGASIDEMDKIAHLLSTLPSEYDGVVTAIETLCEDNLTMELVQMRLLDQELKLNDSEKDTSAKCLQTVVVSNKQNKQQKYKKVFKPYKNYNNNKLKRITCYHCGKQGHVKKDCYKLKNELKNGFNNENNRSVNFAEKENKKYSFMAFRNNQRCIDDKIKFIVDSGASDHMVNRRELLHNLKKLSAPVKVFVAKNDVYNEINEMGDVLVMSNGNEILLKNVLLCEDIPYNLISVIRMRAAGLDVVFNDMGVLIKKGSSIVMHEMQLADAMTKTLATPRFLQLRTLMNLK